VWGTLTKISLKKVKCLIFSEVEVMQVLRDMKNKNMGWEEYQTKL
jgi:hypothetical protein